MEILVKFTQKFKMHIKALIFILIILLVFLVGRGIVLFASFIIFVLFSFLPLSFFGLSWA